MLSTGSPITLSTRPSVSLPTGTVTGSTQVLDAHAAHQTVGGLQSDGAHAALADVLRHLADDVDRIRYVEALAGNADRGPDDGNLPFGEFDVHGRSGHLDHFS